MTRRFRIIAYDVACDRQRARVEKLALRVAARVQDSVFEGWMTDGEVDELLRRAQPLIEPSTDSLRVYSLCAECRPQTRCLGAGAPPVPISEVIV